MTEAEKLAAELTEPMAGFPNPTQLESKAAALLRSQEQDLIRHRELLVKHLAEIDPLREKVKEQAAEIERLTAELKFAHMNGYEGGKQEARDAAHEDCQRKDALLRDIGEWMDRWQGSSAEELILFIQERKQLRANIKTELGEQT